MVAAVALETVNVAFPAIGVGGLGFAIDDWSTQPLTLKEAFNGLFIKLIYATLNGTVMFGSATGPGWVESPSPPPQAEKNIVIAAIEANLEKYDIKLLHNSKRKT
jgi:hypothetical protein